MSHCILKCWHVRSHILHVWLSIKTAIKHQKLWIFHILLMSYNRLRLENNLCTYIWGQHYWNFGQKRCIIYWIQAAFCWSLHTHVTNLNPFENLSPTCKIPNHVDSYENDWILLVKMHRKGKCVWPLWMILFRLYNMSPLRSWVRVTK